MKEEQRTTLKASLDGQDVFALFPAGFSNSLIYQAALLVIWFADLIDQSQSVIDGDTQIIYPITCQVFLQVPAHFQTVSSEAFPDGCV